MDERVDTPWQGDWKERLVEKLASMGFGTLEEFLSANPGVGYVNLAKMLTDANVAALQLYGEQIRTAASTGRLREGAKDSLVRFLAEHIKRGWDASRHFTFRLAAALADWKSSLIQFGSQNSDFPAKLDAVINALREASPPKGWVPKSPSDEHIERAFAKGWPIDHPR
jgi:hypothetical protein